MKSPKSLLITNTDKHCAELLSRIENNALLDPAIDCSSSHLRPLKLLMKKRVSLGFLAKSFIASTSRGRPDYNFSQHPHIISNKDLVNLVKKNKYKSIYLYKAGLIINKTTLRLGIPIYNIHCASLTNYGGLGAIYRALKNKDFNQSATLHLVTSRIDEGEIIAEKKYTLDPKLSFRKNEDIAYRAGLDLFIEHLG